MKLLIHLESIKDLKAKGYKVDDKDYSGAQAITSKWEKDVDGRSSTKFNKGMGKTLDDRAWIDLSVDLAMLFSEVAAREIILMINKAAKMYGFGATMFPVPMEMEYTIDYNKKNNTLQAHIVSSSYNKITSRNDRSEKQNDLVYDYKQKLMLFNVLLGNIDYHGGNVVTHAEKKRLYAIDFGLAFSSNFKTQYKSEVDRYINNLQARLNGKNQDLKKKKTANFINFIDSFVENNAEVMRKVLRQTYKEISKKVAESIIKAKASKEIHDNALSVLNMLERTANEKIKTLNTNIEVVREACQEILKYIEEL